MRLGTLITNTDRSAFAAGRPTDGDTFRSLLAPLRTAWVFEAHDLTAGQCPPDCAGFDGFILGGSPASVHDASPWILQAQSLICQAHAAGVKLFGACLGHQVIATARGGTAGRNPGDWMAARIVRLFEAQDSAASRSIAAT